MTLPEDVAPLHAQGWQPWEIAEATGRSKEKIGKLLADYDADVRGLVESVPDAPSLGETSETSEERLTRPGASFA